MQVKEQHLEYTKKASAITAERFEKFNPANFVNSSSTSENKEMKRSPKTLLHQPLAPNE